jgi:Ca-activated chloride channel family protein
MYVFPASTRAAVHGMRMKIGKRVIEAEIKERKQARAIYNRAKAAGQRTSLLEQQRANVFTMNVANIMPNDTIVVELDYSELLTPTDGVYEFVYPTVVGPRYGGGANPRTDKWISNPYLRQGQKHTYKFGLKAHVESPIGIKQLSSPSHQVNVNWASRRAADLTLKNSGGGNRDFVLKYRLSGNRIETGVMTFKHRSEKFFLLMMEPPKRVKRAHIPRREYIFVLDVSGSMYGFPLNTAKVLIKNLMRSLKSNEYFNVVLFAGTSFVMHPRSVRATSHNLKRAVYVIDRQRGGGGTELMAALKNAYSIPKPARKGISRTVVVITDGYVGVEAQTFRFIRKQLNHANCFAFGIGSSVNRGLIEGMARAGMGEPFVVLNRNHAPTEAAKFRKYIASPVLTEIKVKFKNVRTYDVVPSKQPDLLAKRPLIVFGKYRGNPRGSITVTGMTGKGAFRKVMSLNGGMSKAQNRPIRELWARKWVEILHDQLVTLPGNPDLKKAITNVGLTYNLLTPYTSFVAVDKRVVNRGGRLVMVKQPLPLPKGVSNYAVGGRTRARGYYRRSVRRYSYSNRYGGLAPRAPLKSRPRYYAPAPGASASPAPKATETAADRAEAKKRSKRPRAKVTSTRNITPVDKRVLKRILPAKLNGSGCLWSYLPKRRTVRITLIISRSGKLTVKGASGSFKWCLVRLLSPTLSKMARNGMWITSSRPMVIKLKLRWR